MAVLFFSPLQMGKNVVYCQLSHLCEKYEFVRWRMAGGKHILGKPKSHRIFGTARVGERGQIVIPKEARQFYGIRPGDTVLVLGSGESGLVLSKPEVLDRVARQILEDMGRNEEK